MPDQAAGQESGSKQVRARKRIQWKPDGESDGADTEPRIDIEIETTKSNSENDDRLRADKPPHWS